MKTRKTIYIDDETWRKLKTIAAENGVTLGEQIKLMVDEKKDEKKLY